jgi:hypothetical protein
MKVLKPTDTTEILTKHVSVFLAGSIEMGAAEDWQSRVAEEFKELENLVFYNPRRDNWDSSWKQEEKSPNFNYQVNWEMNHLDKCAIIFMYFDPSTKSPISLLELGAYGASGRMVVCCPEGFWRKGNVEVFCTRHNIPLANDLESGIGILATKISMIL